jgi:hypothetical protein
MMPRTGMTFTQRVQHVAEQRKRDYRLVAEDGVAPADELQQRDIEASIERQRKTYGAAPTVVEALAYQLRGGFHVLRKASTQRRLSELDERQVLDMAKRLGRERSGAPPWSETEIKAFLELWKANRT